MTYIPYTHRASDSSETWLVFVIVADTPEEGSWFDMLCVLRCLSAHHGCKMWLK